MNEESNKTIYLYGDEIGSVSLVDHMGTDLTIVNSARVSFGNQKTELNDKDRRLIKFLVKHKHTSTFEHNVATFKFVVPLFVRSQHHRHRTWSYNEISRRYVDTEPEFYVPDTWRAKADNAKQGSSEETIDINPVGNRAPPMVDIYKLAMQRSLWTYEELLRKGVCPEQARMVLPQSMYTSYYVTGSLYAWARAYNLRSDSHAQKEIQEVADQWNRICIGRFPASWSALTEENKYEK